MVAAEIAHFIALTTSISFKPYVSNLKRDLKHQAAIKRKTGCTYVNMAMRHHTTSYTKRANLDLQEDIKLPGTRARKQNLLPYWFSGMYEDIRSCVRACNSAGNMSTLRILSARAECNYATTNHQPTVTMIDLQKRFHPDTPTANP